jgi:hypothetical protein
MKGKNQYPSTGFHSLVTKKFDKSLDEKDYKKKTFNIMNDRYNKSRNISELNLNYSISRGS